MSLDGHPHLAAPDRSLAWLARRPRTVMIATVATGAALGWAWLAAVVGSMLASTDMATLGPGMGILNGLNGLAGLPESVRASIAVLCSPDGAHFGMPGAGAWGPRDLAVVFLMWVMMALAMMLPTAAPMLGTYADIAEAAARKGERAVSVLVLAAGYLTVWVGFSALATLAQWGLTALRALTPAMAPASLVLAGTTLIAAGLYQFTPMKHACLVRCRSPMPFFFARWTERAAGVYRLGLEQGLFCFGCCWALMTVMFAVGVMNVVWIAVIGVAMAVEKTVSILWLSRAIGAALILWGAALLLASPVGARLLEMV
ncbi:DUF2182 domain-containing protein [Prosthecomicrobium sp. N25]|uniref:DUF2182 domain-containing protein n=1 Tax=Prosthecomicrobium sp. N25 TaxID=3129254 RepID=UPI003076E977